MGSLDPYPIIEIEEPRRDEDEAMGTKPKFWCSHPQDDTPWLFKYPQPETGQHWAEKIAAEIADHLEIPHAVVELATFKEERGSVSRSFTVNHLELIHGNEALAKIIPYDTEKRFKQSSHTIHNILSTIENAFEKAPAATAAMQQFAAYVVLDALIGNTDRHHENWGFLVKRTPTGPVGFLAPSFDHASSLGRELRDEKRAQLLRDGMIEHYCKRGRGAIYWADSGGHGPSPLSLLRSAILDFPDLFLSPASEAVTRETSFDDFVHRVPNGWMSGPAREFAIETLRYNASEITKCLS